MTRYPIVELRQYTLRPGRRDELIELFDRELVETQEAVGMAVLGQFRDLDDPDRFVWLRGFPDMASRKESLGAFYGGPVWKAHGRAANATMVDSDDVLLLRPVGEPFPEPPEGRPPVGRPAPASVVHATLCFADRPFDDGFSRHAAAPLACLSTEYAENTFPALPVRAGEHVFVWFSRSPGRTEVPGATRTEQLRLAPTARSLVR
jgi:hypothetical protein